jgi:curli biogenesis system outer membrane secretion channel CsgG
MSRQFIRRLAVLPALIMSSVSMAQDIGAMATTATGPKTPALKTVTNFSQALRCMDDLFLAYGKSGIVITSAGIPDETGKVRTGTKEMMITAMAKMTVKSNAFEFIDFHGNTGGAAMDDLARLFEAKGMDTRKMPDYYLRGSITQMDDNAVRKSSGFGFSLPFLDLGSSKDSSYDVVSMDMSIGEAATRKILPTTSGSNTMVIVKGGKSMDGGGKIGKIGFSFNMDLSKSEGLGATTRTLVELGLIETLGKFTQVPYWRCLDADITNPVIREQAAENFDLLKEKDRILFIQRKLGGSLGVYKGPMDGVMNDTLKESIMEYQAKNHLIADGRVNFDIYASLLDDLTTTQAAVPEPARAAPATAPRPSSAPAAAPQVQYAPAGVVATQAASGPFKVSLDSDHGARPAYKVGDFLNMNLSLNADGTAFCYYEDAGKSVARIFPNQFFPNSNLRANKAIRLPSGGFKIKFDKAGKERVACIAADREVVIPPNLKGTPDLAPLPVRSLEDVVNLYRLGNPSAVATYLDISIAR